MAILVDAVRDTLDAHREVHVWTSTAEQAAGVMTELEKAACLPSPARFLGETPLFPPGPLVVSVGSQVGFHYIRAHVMNVAACTPIRDRITAAGVVLLGISPTELEKVPCRILDCAHPAADGTCRELGRVFLRDIVEHYAGILDLGPDFTLPE